ncbi:MAG: tRNA (N(6)-L-threonylcarbamoyladenosine(37)-C(2))-methylthiotransferase MtaB [Clostridiaceae bacterium]|nr:tRNA (N(6)-L-threonylcarbamoyladenosine(37)-C(2))-methylthiotransferase MtaB [Clostridiaceae bacterium]
MRVGFLTLGCKVNSYETEQMQARFREAGCLITSFGEEADIYIINTCTVTNIADRKSRKMLHRARRKNPDAIVVAAGCYADFVKKKGETDADGSVDLFLSNQDKNRIVDIVMEKWMEKNGNCKAVQEQDPVQTCNMDGSWKSAAPAGGLHVKEEFMTKEALAERHTRAYLQVQNGCNQYCTYCIIPYVRGPLTSKPPAEVLNEVRALAADGIREIVVTGIHLSSYGVDFSGQTNFLKMRGKPLLALLQQLAAVDGIERIRLGSLEPRIITEDFVAEMAKLPKLCPHFHLSLQSGCDATLKRMNRHYSTEEYLECVSLLRRYFPNPAVTTDIIVGFPQETEEEFEATCHFAEQAAFSKIHVFKYSRRKGTIADAMEGQIPEQEKAERSTRLLKLEQGLAQDYQNAFIGKSEPVLLEEMISVDGVSYLVGYNERYVRIAVPAEGMEKPDSLCNRIFTVRISKRLTSEILLGEIGTGKPL